MGIRLFVGGHPGTVQGDRENLTGDRMFTASRPPQLAAFPCLADLNAYLDSGAFSDPPERRLTPEGALDRQLAWEYKASEKWGSHWQASGLVSYDLLIDEVWANGKRHKRRWSIKDADRAVTETIDAARYLAGQRDRLSPRRLILSAQGVDAIQYRECIQEVLAIAQPGDIIGFGGWCILGRFKSWLPEFWRTLQATLPLVAANGNQDIHIFGVLYQPALGGLLWLADRYGLSVSTDSSAPIKSAACTSPESRRKAGVRAEGHWHNNVEWWRNSLATLHGSEWYREPPDTGLIRQLSFQEGLK